MRRKVESTPSLSLFPLKRTFYTKKKINVSQIKRLLFWTLSNDCVSSKFVGVLSEFHGAAASSRGLPVGCNLPIAIGGST